ncbi:MAG TPA: trypsin-like peptidase domain-containing protein [Candidatus Krumholzibacteria bacterium]|nr:trypsin-like peptidase domain-containing protein [Candidatus Krumholzibacteria bacterium]
MSPGVVRSPSSSSAGLRLVTLVVAGLLLSVPAGARETAAAETTAWARALPDLVERVEPAVVQVLSTRFGRPASGPTQPPGQQLSTGAGVIVDPRGYVLTNHHVVDGARRVRVVLSQPRETGQQTRSVLEPRGEILGAQIVGTDLETDLAVLKIDAENLNALPFGDSEAVRQGQLVFALGSPRGLDGSVSLGVVSATARQFQDGSPMIYIQSDVAVNPGNSGGPLVDTHGRLVGINSFIVSGSGGSEGLSFAVPSNIARTVFEQIRNTGRVQRGIVGVNPQTITPLMAEGLGLGRSWGVVLGDVFPGGPAAMAGLRTGDVVLSLDGKPMENGRQLRVNLYGKPIGDSVRLEVLRGSRRLAFDVSVAERPDDPQRFGDLVDPEDATVERLGIMGLDLDRELASMFGAGLRSRSGVVVAAVLFSLSPLEGGLAPGDIVRGLNGVTIGGVDDLRRAVDDLTIGEPAVLHVERMGQLLYVTLQIDS